MSHIFDTDFDLAKKLYDKVLNTPLMNKLMINQFAWSAAHFKEQNFLTQVL